MALKLINFKDKDLSLLQDNVNSALTPIQNSALVGGQILTNISLTAAQDNLISHQLGYVPTIILPLVPTANSVIWSPVSTSLHGSNASTSQINLRCSANCVVSVVVK